MPVLGRLPSDSAVCEIPRSMSCMKATVGHPMRMSGFLQASAMSQRGQPTAAGVLKVPIVNTLILTMSGQEAILQT